MKMHELPDERGHFGRYGGVFVAETLVADARRSPDLHQARGSQPYRRSQDQQHRRPGARREAHGQTARHRRDRRRDARRGCRDGGGALRHGMRGVHGLGGHQAPGAERLSHEASRGGGRAGRIGIENAEGRAERGDARLGHACRQHLLYHRLRRWPAPVSDDGARLSVGHRARVPDADAGAVRQATGRGDRLRRRGLERNGHLLPLYPVRSGQAHRRGGGWTRNSQRQACGIAVRGQAGGTARKSHLSASGRTRSDHRDALDLGRAGLPGCWPRARLAQGHRSGRICHHRRRRSSRRVPRLVPLRGHHSGARVRACARPGGEARAHAVKGQNPAGQSLGTGGQGYAHRRGKIGNPILSDPRATLLNGDLFDCIVRVPEASVDLIVADPPYGLGKDYGNDSDCLSGEAYLAFSRRWIDAVIPKLKPSGSLYVFLTWQHSPEVFSYLKTRLTMVNEIVWDRKVPSMGGSTRKFSSVHDTIGLFACSKEYFFDIDSVRIPYDAETKRARTRSIFVGKKWLEVGYNPRDVWSVTRIHRQDPERENHPTQKPLEIVERMVLASCPPEGLVLDPFMGSGTVAVAALKHGRSFVGIEINPEYCALAKRRVARLCKPDVGAVTSPVRSAEALRKLRCRESSLLSNGSATVRARDGADVRFA